MDYLSREQFSSLIAVVLNLRQTITTLQSDLDINEQFQINSSLDKH